jgi:hydroxymethylpyrimidine/phosphomethylpyrimidine kinase
MSLIRLDAIPVKQSRIFVRCGDETCVSDATKLIKDKNCVTRYRGEMKMKHILTIAGSDSCGGAGIQADLKTFAALGVYGMSVITAVTAQNTTGVTAVQEITPAMVAAQMDAIFTDIRVDGVKIGMVASEEIIAVIAEKLSEYAVPFIVLDPVMVAKSGHFLLREEAREALIARLIPRATIITPNLSEAQALTGAAVTDLAEMKEAARMIYEQGVTNVLVKGGHLPDAAVDVLYDGREFTYFEGPRIATNNTHGTGCTYSSAIAANLGKGLSLIEAIGAAKEYITRAINESFALGRGCGPVHHFHPFYSGD